MSVSIVVLNYNDFEGTEYFINSIKNFKSLNRIIIVDNNSHIECQKKLRLLENDKVEVIYNKQNNGYSAGNNIGIKYLREKYNEEFIIISNSDIEIQEHAILACEDFLRNHKEYAMCSPKMIEYNNNQTRIGWKIPNYTECLLLTIPYFSRIVSKKISINEKDFNNQAIIDVEVLPGSFFMIKGELIERINYLDEETFLYCEEDILAYKIKKINYKGALLTRYTYIHMHSVSIDKNISSKIKKFEILRDSRLIFLKKYLNVNKYQILLFKIIYNFMIILRIIELKINKKMKGNNSDNINK